MTERVLEFTDSLCKRPGMYVGRHDFREAVAFLAGYRFGIVVVAHRWKQGK